MPRVPDRRHSTKNVTLIEPTPALFLLSLSHPCSCSRAPPPHRYATSAAVSPRAILALPGKPPPLCQVRRHVRRRRTRARRPRGPRRHSTSPGLELSPHPRFVPCIGESLSCHLDLWCSDIDGRTLVEYRLIGIHLSIWSLLTQLYLSKC